MDVNNNDSECHTPPSMYMHGAFPPSPFCSSLTQRPPAAGNQDVVDDFLKRKQQAAAYRARALGQVPSEPHHQRPQQVRVGGAGAGPFEQAAPVPAAQPVPYRGNKAEKVSMDGC